MEIGFARVDVTPPIGAEMPGSFSKRCNVGVHDPLHARAMVVSDSKTRVALVGVDALSLKHSVVRRARELATEWCGFGPNIMACASHTHSGGPATGPLGSDPDEEYLRFLSLRIAQAVTLADRAKVPARLGIGAGHEDTVAFNRRFWMKDGKQATHPGKGNPETVRVAGPIDPEVGVLGAWSLEGQYLGCLVNYTCHCTVFGGLEVSADYPFYMDRTVRDVMGEDSVTVFVNGAYGDVTQVSNTLLREAEFGEKWARRVGTVLGGEAVKVLSRMEPREEARLQAAVERIGLTPRPVTAERLAEAQALLATDGPWDVERWYARELVLLDEMNREEPLVPAEVQVLAVGEAALVAIPGEYFCRFGLDIKAQSPFPHTWIAGTANGCVGYIPTAEAMGPNGGGYEPRLCRSSKLVPEAGGELQDTALKLLRRLEPPPPPPAPEVPPAAPWNVGASRAGA
jgi:hypothetical protein